MEIIKPECMLLTSRGVVVCDQRDNSRLVEIRVDERTNRGSSTVMVDKPGSLIRGVTIDHAGISYYTNVRDQTVNLIVEGRSWILAGHPMSINLKTIEGKGLYASFRSPHGIVADQDQNLYVTDRLDHRIRKISKSSNFASYFAGSGIQGFQDGAGSTARFSQPHGIILFRSTLYVADSMNHAIRSVSLGSGEVSTVAGNQQKGNLDGPASQSQFDTPTSLVAYKQFIFVSESGGGVRAINIDTSTVFTLHKLRNVELSGIAVLDNKHSREPRVIVSDFLGCTILSMRLVSDCAGELFSSKVVDKCGVCGGKDECVDCAGVPRGKSVKDSCGTCRDDGGDCNARGGRVEGGVGDFDALFRSLGKFVGKSAGSWKSPDRQPAKKPQVQQLVPLPRAQMSVQVKSRWGIQVSTLYGTGVCKPWNVGSSSGNQLNRPEGVVSDSHGRLYVSDTGNNVIRVLDVSSGKILKTIGNEVSGLDNAGGHFGTFNGPSGLAMRGDGSLFVSDSFNSAIRQVDLASSNPRISSMSLQRPISSPRGIASHPSGSLLVTDAEKRSLWEISRYGMRMLDSRSFPLGEPRALACNQHGDIFLADLNGRVLLYQVQQNRWQTLVSKGAMPDGEEDRRLAISSPCGLAVDGRGNVFIADRSSHCIYLLTAKGSRLLLVAGNGQAGRRDGESAQLYQPYALALAEGGKVLAVTEKGSCQVRLIRGIDRFLEDDSKVGKKAGKVATAAMLNDHPAANKSIPVPPPLSSSSSSGPNMVGAAFVKNQTAGTPPPVLAAKKAGEGQETTSRPSSGRSGNKRSVYQEFDDLKQEAKKSNLGVIDPFAYTSKIDAMKKKAEGGMVESHRSRADVAVAGGRVVDVEDPNALPADFVARVEEEREEERTDIPDIVKRAESQLARAGSNLSEIERIKLQFEEHEDELQDWGETEGAERSMSRGPAAAGQSESREDSLIERTEGLLAHVGTNKSEIDRVKRQIEDEDTRGIDEEKIENLFAPSSHSFASTSRENPSAGGTERSEEQPQKDVWDEEEELLASSDLFHEDGNVSVGDFRISSVVSPGQQAWPEDNTGGREQSSSRPRSADHFDDGFAPSTDVELLVMMMGASRGEAELCCRCLMKTT
eukprot:760685-Hanusia_phi.AAC.1